MAHGISVPAGGRGVVRGPKRLLALRGDDHLLDRLRHGDETAFEVIYERHVPGVLSFCRHMLGSREEAEDAVQQAFTAAHRDLLRDGREIRLKPWLYAIARNRCLSMLRARKELAREDFEARTDGFHDQVQQRAELRELVADLQDLPEDQRAALLLSELRDLSHAEVATVLGCREANVKGLVFRARSGLSERREAREAQCGEIQEELATARGGALRRGRLRHHLRSCMACSAYLEEVRSQRKMMAMILPVIPTVGLKQGVLAAVGIGGAAGGGGAAAGGGLLTALLPASGATVAKVAVVGALVAGGGGIAGEAALDQDGPSASSPPAAKAPFRAVTPGGSPSTRSHSGDAAKRGRHARFDAVRRGLEGKPDGRARASSKRRAAAGRSEAGALRIRPSEAGARRPAPRLPAPKPLERLKPEPRITAPKAGARKRLGPLAPAPPPETTLPAE